MELIDKRMNLQEDSNRKLEARVEQIQKDTQLMFKTHSYSIHNLEVQMGQIANALTSRSQGNLPSNTETNSREHVKAITLRNGKELAQPKESKLIKLEHTKIDDSSKEAGHKEDS